MNSRLPSSYALALPLLIFLAVMLVYPVAALLGQGVAGAAMLEVWGSAYFQGRLGWTFLQAFVSVCVVVLLGVPAAVMFSKYEFRGRGLVEALLGLPFVVPTIVVGMGFLSLFGARGVLFNLSDTPWLVLLANVFYNYGVVVRSVSVSLETLDRDLESAAILEGASGWQVFRFVIVPFALPAIFSSAALVFLYCFASFGVPLLLGGSTYATLEVEVFLSVQRLELNTAGALALLQLSVTLLATLLYTGFQARSSLTLEGVSTRVHAQGAARGWLMVHIAFALLLTLVPLAAVLWRGVWSANGLTLEHYIAAFTPGEGIYSSDVFSAILNNLRFVAFALLVAVPLGVAHALAVWRTRSRFLDAVSLLPLMVSATLLGVSYIAVYSAAASSLGLLIAAYALSAYPFVTRGALTGLRAIPLGTLEAARVDGAGGWTLFRFVTLPLISSNLRVGMSFAFAVVIGEFGATLVLQRPEWATLTTAIYERLGRPGQLGEASALASVLLLLTTLGFLSLRRDSR
jgi:thiamine transport system permease protein